MKILLLGLVVLSMSSCTSQKLTDQDDSGLISQDIRVIVDMCEDEYFRLEFEEYNAFSAGCHQGNFTPTSDMRCTDTKCIIKKDSIKK